MRTSSQARVCCSGSVSTASAGNALLPKNWHDLIVFLCYTSAIFKKKFIITMQITSGFLGLIVSVCVCVRVRVSRECLRSVIMLCEDPEVACPYRDETYSCSCILQEREIKAVSSQENASSLKHHVTIPLLHDAKASCNNTMLCCHLISIYIISLTLLLYI